MHDAQSLDVYNHKLETDERYQKMQLTLEFADTPHCGVDAFDAQVFVVNFFILHEQLSSHASYTIDACNRTVPLSRTEAIE